MKKIVVPEGLPKPIGYSPAVRAGNLLFISGQIAENVKGEIVGKRDFETQVRQVFDNLRAILAAEGGTLDDLVQIRIYLTDIKNLAKFRKIRSEYFKKDHPASTLIAVKSLIMKDLLIEIDGIAVLR
ncbi:MAG: RidA family protein [Candidatus Hadarchaeaceae archaeon]